MTADDLPVRADPTHRRLLDGRQQRRATSTASGRVRTVAVFIVASSVTTTRRFMPGDAERQACG
ncbi:MAG: hypothetical protein ACRDS0_07365 [Pseudonocardiaceae bacterium]